MGNWRYVEAKRKLAFLMALLIFVLAIPRFGNTVAMVSAEEPQDGGIAAVSGNGRGVTPGDAGFTVAIQQSGAGTVSPNDVGEMSKPITVSAGDSLTLVLLPDTGNQFAGLSVNGEEKSPSDCSMRKDEKGRFNGSWQYELTNISENTTVKAVFDAIEPRTVSIGDAGIQLWRPDGTEIQVHEGDYYLQDEQVTISAPADKLIRLQNTDVYSQKLQLNVGQIPTLKSFYICEENPAVFGTEEKLELTEPLKWIVDQTPPTLALNATEFWVKADCPAMTVFGNVTDQAPDRVVWFSEKPAVDEEAAKVSGETVNAAAVEENGTFTVSGIALDSSKITETFYFYAVDKSERYSDCVEVHVYKDGEAPVISAAETQGLKNEMSFGNFGRTDAALLLTVGDVSGSDCNASGVAKIEVYAEDDAVKTYTKELEGSSPDEGMEEVTVALSREDLKLFSQLKELKLKVTDRVGNVSGEYTLSSFGLQSDEVMLEDKAPEITVKMPAADFTDVQAGNVKKYWYRTAPSVSYDVTDKAGMDPGSGLAKGSVLFNGEELDTYSRDYTKTDTSYASVIQNETRTVSANDLTGMVNGENILKICYEDYAGNCSEAEQALYLDNMEPQITEFLIEKDVSLLDRMLSFLPFGTYSNSEVRITVSANDAAGVSGNEEAASGVNQITLYLNGEAYATRSVTEDGAVFVLPGEEILEGTGKVYLDAKVSASASDMVGNHSTITNMTTDNSNLKNSNLMIETVMPLIDIRAESEMYVDEAGVAYNNTDINLTVSAKDTDSGLGSVLVKMNGTTLIDAAYDQLTKEDVFVVSTADVPGNNNGFYDLEVTVEDNAGNVISETKRVNKDETAPEIIRIDMEAAGTVEADGAALSYTEQEYGYYFHEATKVTIYGADGKETGGSGVKEIEYYLVSVTGKVGSVVNKTVDEDEKVSFVIPAEFKGQIYMRAYDNVANVPTGYVTPSGLIIETPEQHAKEEHISFSKEGASYQDNEGRELYAGDVNVTIGVTDTYSGIRSVEWEVESPYDTGANQQGSLTIDNQGGFTSDSDAAGWSVTRSDKNLVTSLENTIRVTNNSNHIVVRVTMTDRAGNSSESEIVFSIDKTQPEIQVAFDLQEPTGAYEQIFNQNRTATITVRERNFSADNITAAITNTDGAIPSISGWSTSENADNPDQNVHTATITFSADGDYTLEISGHDRAGHAAASVRAEDFTIDQTPPVISVAYSDENALNGNYFAAERMATIRIEEHNFAEQQVRISGTATDAGNTIAFPQASSFRTEGDVHTATLTCGSDGLYRFDVEYTDKAGNVAEVYTGEEYYVDMTAPTIEITGVEDMSANNGEVVPRILLSDTNYDRNSVKIELTGANLGSVDPEGSFTDQGSGQIFTFADFPREKAKDDIYTLTATLTDLAGNESTDSIVFSVNRFGSVYILDDSLKEISGTYISQEIDVKLTEINVDNLEHDKIRVVVDANGTPKTLTEGSDYTVRESGGNGNWYQYDYVIDKSLFAGDGRYIVTLYSVDAAGNVNENIEESKKAEITFGVDKTAPIVIPIDIQSDTQYAVDVKTATVAVNDNLVLEDVAIYIGEEQCDYAAEGENYTFDIPGATVRQEITVSARDAAGNRTNYVISDVLVTTNAFIRWYNNTPLFVGSLLGAAVVSGGGTGLFAALRKRRLKFSK